MRCDCGRYSLDPVCGFCLTERRNLTTVAEERYVIPRIERSGLHCSCGAWEPMVAEVGSTVGWEPSSLLPSSRLLWHRCVACGRITRETLVPAGI